jgi:hypothetical protein
MQKIPVGATIAHAYRFAFGNIPAIVKAIWLPLLAQLVVFFLITRRLALFLAAVHAHDPSAVSLFGPLLLLFPLVIVFFFAQFTAVMELALGRPPQSWVGFHFDRTMWRLLGGFVAALAAMIALFVTTFLVVWVIGFGLDMFTKAAPAARMPVAIFYALLFFAFMCAQLYIALRLLFLLAPINVSEQRLGVREAWALSKGNFWRAFLTTLAIVVPIAILNYTYVFSLAGLPEIIPGASKEARESAEMAWRIKEMNLMADKWYITLPLTGLLMLFQLGAGCAAQAFAYRKLTENSAPVAGSALPD